MAVVAVFYWIYSIPMIFEVRKDDGGFAPALVLSGLWIFSKRSFNEGSWDRFGIGRLLFGLTMFLGVTWVVLNAI